MTTIPTSLSIRLALVLAFAFSNCGAIAADPKWPDEVQEWNYRSSADNTKQPALIYDPESTTPVPLVVALHAWSADYRGGADGPGYATECIRRGWAFLHPNFRGPSKRSEACGSELVVKDILSAVQKAKRKMNVDPKRVYLLGVSGGGHAALLMAGRSPESWTAVSAWAAITDLRAWWDESKHKTGRKYWRDIESACGGPPGTKKQIDREYAQRSPLTWLPQARGVPIEISTGIHDGHTGSVPVSHTLLAFNALAAKKDRIKRDQIKFIENTERIPLELRCTISDPKYKMKRVLLRRESGKTRVTIFEGGHEIVTPAAFAWFDSHPERPSSGYRLSR